MKKLVLCLLCLIPATAYADLIPLPDCDECLEKCYDCCTKTAKNADDRLCSSDCKYVNCNYERLCADVIQAKPDMCSGSAPQQDGDSQTAPEPKQTNDVQPAKDENDAPKNDENKSSCSAMTHSTGHGGPLALLGAGLFGLMAFGVRRKCRN